MQTILIVARKEFLDGIRNRWVLAISIALAIMSISLSYFGAAASGFVGFTSVATTVASLATLIAIVTPLISLLLGYDTFASEAENGTLLLLLSYPFSRSQLLAGKWLGHCTMLAISISLGLGSAGLVIGFFAVNSHWQEVIPAFFLLIFSAVLLSWIFLSMAYFISVCLLDRGRAAGVAIFLWLFFVVIYDLALLGILVTTEGQVNKELFPWLLVLNPTDIFRLINIQFLSTHELTTGLMTTANETGFSISFLIIALFFWLLMTVLLTQQIFKTRML